MVLFTKKIKLKDIEPEDEGGAMIELKNDSLVFSFSDVHPEARLSIDFQRTLRIPDDGDDYPLPPGLGRFPLQHDDDFAGNIPRVQHKKVAENLK